MKILELTPDLIGKEISCKIYDDVITLAKIQYAPDDYDWGKMKYFICQNVRDGGWSNIDRLGFEYGWSVNDGKPISLSNNAISNIQLINNESNYEIY